MSHLAYSHFLLQDGPYPVADCVRSVRLDHYSSAWDNSEELLLLQDSPGLIWDCCHNLTSCTSHSSFLLLLHECSSKGALVNTSNSKHHLRVCFLGVHSGKHKHFCKNTLQCAALPSSSLCGVRKCLFQRSNKGSLYLAFLKYIPKYSAKGLFHSSKLCLWGCFIFLPLKWWKQFSIRKGLLFLKNELIHFCY